MLPSISNRTESPKPVGLGLFCTCLKQVETIVMAFCLILQGTDLGCSVDNFSLSTDARSKGGRARTIARRAEGG